VIAPGSIRPQLATLVDRVPAGAGWQYEIKYDGYRVLAHVRGSEVRLISRNGLEWTARFAGIQRELKRLRLRDAVLDGEVCYLLDDGRTDFQHLQNSLHGAVTAERQDRLVYFVFDLLLEDGTDWRGRPLTARRDRLQRVLQRAGGPVRFGEHLSGDGAEVLEQACKLGLEGIIVKRADAPYRAGRSTDWLKVKCSKRQEFVIVGWTPPRGARSGFGSLLLAVRDGAALKYAGKVGTGFSQRSLAELAARLARLRIDAPAVIDPPRERGVTWVKPKLVCEVTFTEFTREGSLRHPSFEGLREDKTVNQVRRERATPVGRVSAAKKQAVGGRSPARASARRSA
jgi:bifunctional non-homologous end joining protein LigD